MKDPRILSASFIVLFFSLVLGILIFNWPFRQQFPTEFVHVGVAQQFAQGRQPYQNFYDKVVPLARYTPGFYLLPAALGKLLHAEQSPVWFLRIFRYTSWGLGFLAIGGLIQLKRRETGSAFLAVAAGALWLCCGGFIFYKARGDWMSAWFVFLAYHQLNQGTEARRIVWAAFFSALAFLFKINVFPLFFAASFWLLLGHKKKKALGFSALYLGIVFTVMIFFNAISGGWASRMILEVNAGMPRNFLFPFKFLFIQNPLSGYFVCLALTSLICSFKKIDFKSKEGLLVFYFLFALIQYLLTAQSIGAAIHHLLDTGLATALVLITACHHEWFPFHFRWGKGLLIFPLAAALLLTNAGIWRGVFHGRMPEESGDRFTKQWEFFSGLSASKILTDVPEIAFRANQPESAMEVDYYADMLLPKKVLNLQSWKEQFRAQPFEMILSERKGPLEKLGLEAWQLYYKEERLIPDQTGGPNVQVWIKKRAAI
ncbi:MAG: hypothetical protein EXS63_07895 [Candidatus Omnitrophica bacterium]|nr:hypothetical protein [Candidatus Omnitrophota bacterium]